MNSSNSKQQNNSFYQRHKVLVWIFAVVIIFSICANLIMPVLIKRQLNGWLKENGEDNVRIDYVTFNLFMLRTTVHVLVAENPPQGKLQWQHLVLNLQYFPLLQKRILIKDFKLHNAAITVTRTAGGALFVGGLQVRKPAKSQKEKTRGMGGGWEIGLDNADIRSVVVNYRGSVIRQAFTIDAEVDRLYQWDPSGTTHLDLQIAVDSGVFQLTGYGKPLKKQKSFIIEAKFDTIPLGWLYRAGGAVGVYGFDAHLKGAVHAQGYISSDGNFSFTSQDTLFLVKCNLYTNTVSADYTNLEYKGTIEARRKRRNQPIQLSSTGTTQINPFKGGIQQQNIYLSIDNTALQGNFSLFQNVISFSGTGTMKGLSITDTLQRMLLAYSENITIGTIETPNQKTIKLKNVTVSTAGMLKPLANVNGESNIPVLGADLLSLDSAKIDSGVSISVENIRLTGTRTNIVRWKNGNLNVTEYLKPFIRKKPVPPPKAPPPVFYLTNFDLTGVNYVNFNDYSVIPTVSASVNNMTANLHSLIVNPVSQIDSFSFRGTLSPYSQIKAEGSFDSIRRNTTGKVLARIDGFNLPALSGYISDLIGYQMTTGKFNATMDALVSNNNLDAITVITINNISIKPLPQTDAYKEFSKRFPVSLNTALYVLTDNNGDISITIPISKTIGDPHFDYGDVIRTAIVNGLQKALQDAFSSLGSIVTFGLLDKQESVVSVRAVTFGPGSDTLTGNARTYLDSVATVSNNHPDARILLCGKASRQDIIALFGNDAGKDVDDPGNIKDPVRRSALSLASRRARNVKDYLVLKKQVKAKRLFLCAPEIDSGQESQPRVDIHFGSSS